MAQLPAGRSPAPSQVSRRAVLRGTMLGAGAVTLPAVLAACGGGKSGGSKSGGTVNKTVTLGSNASDAVPKKAYADAYKDFESTSGMTVNVNTVDHNTFQEQINSYLQGKPDLPLPTTQQIHGTAATQPSSSAPTTSAATSSAPPTSSSAAPTSSAPATSSAPPSSSSAPPSSSGKPSPTATCTPALPGGTCSPGPPPGG